MIDLEKIKRLAEAATQGEWAVGENPMCVQPKWRKFAVICSTCYQNDNHSDDAAFIAAANPAAVLEMIAEIERLQSQLAEATVGCSEHSLVQTIDAAMLEMANIHPPLKRSECSRLILAAINAAPAGAPSKPVQGEPVGKVIDCDVRGYPFVRYFDDCYPPIGTMLYTAPAASPVQGEPVGVVVVEHGHAYIDPLISDNELSNMRGAKLYTAPAASPINRRLLEAAKAVLSESRSTPMVHALDSAKESMRLFVPQQNYDALKQAIAEAESCVSQTAKTETQTALRLTSETQQRLLDALEQIAVYPKSRKDELSAKEMRLIARRAIIKAAAISAEAEGGGDE